MKNQSCRFRKNIKGKQRRNARDNNRTRKQQNRVVNLRCKTLRKYKKKYYLEGGAEGPSKEWQLVQQKFENNKEIFNKFIKGEQFNKIKKNLNKNDKDDLNKLINRITLLLNTNSNKEEAIQLIDTFNNKVQQLQSQAPTAAEEEGPSFAPPAPPAAEEEEVGPSFAPPAPPAAEEEEVGPSFAPPAPPAAEEKEEGPSFAPPAPPAAEPANNDLKDSAVFIAQDKLNPEVEEEIAVPGEEEEEEEFIMAPVPKRILNAPVEAAIDQLKEAALFIAQDKLNPLVEEPAAPVEESNAPSEEIAEPAPSIAPAPVAAAIDQLKEAALFIAQDKLNPDILVAPAEEEEEGKEFIMAPVPKKIFNAPAPAPFIAPAAAAAIDQLKEAALFIAQEKLNPDILAAPAEEEEGKEFIMAPVPKKILNAPLPPNVPSIVPASVEGAIDPLKEAALFIAQEKLNPDILVAPAEEEGKEFIMAPVPKKIFNAPLPPIVPSIVPASVEGAIDPLKEAALFIAQEKLNPDILVAPFNAPPSAPPSPPFIAPFIAPQLIDQLKEAALFIAQEKLNPSIAEGEGEGELILAPVPKKVLNVPAIDQLKEAALFIAQEKLNPDIAVLEPSTPGLILAPVPNRRRAASSSSTETSTEIETQTEPNPELSGLNNFSYKIFTPNVEYLNNLYSTSSIPRIETNIIDQPQLDGSRESITTMNVPNPPYLLKILGTPGYSADKTLEIMMPSKTPGSLLGSV